MFKFSRSAIAVLNLLVVCNSFILSPISKSERTTHHLRCPIVHVTCTASPQSRENLDWPARMVEENEIIRRALAVPIGLASAGNWLASCIYVAAKLRIPDELAKGPRSVADLAKDLCVDTEALGRLMRSLAGQGPVLGLFVEVFDSPFGPLILPAPSWMSVQPREQDRRYALTPLGAMLREDGAGSMRPWAIFCGEELGRAWSGGLLSAVRNGAPSFSAAQGAAAGPAASAANFWEYMDRNPAARETFDASMEALSAYSASPGEAAARYDWTLGGAATRVVDVGGGTGQLLASILRRHPGLRGTLFDQAAVVGGAEPVLMRAGVRDRCDVASGSFLDDGAVPGGGDVYVLKSVLHDWGAADAARILRRVRRAMPPAARLVLLEIVRPPRAGPDPWRLDMADFLDLNMLVTVGGRERTRGEWAALLAAAGFDLLRVLPPSAFAPVGSPAAIEARPAPAARAADDDGPGRPQ